MNGISNNERNFQIEPIVPRISAKISDKLLEISAYKQTKKLFSFIILV
jgi:hypothetical protein